MMKRIQRALEPLNNMAVAGALFGISQNIKKKVSS
jgi:hypothetical protein